MALCETGAMSMGGSTVGRSINCELGLSGTAQISLDDADVRDLVSIPSGEISINDFYGASAIPSVCDGCPPGTEVSEGGYYMGTIDVGTTYYLIMSPNATGCACCQFKTTRTGSSVGGNLSDGYACTYAKLTGAIHPAGNFTATRTINGFSDWYLPAKCEMQQFMNFITCPPAGEGFRRVDGSCGYWITTERDSQFNCAAQMRQCGFQTAGKTGFCRVRALRRVPIP